MDILSIIGMILSLGAIFLGQHLEGGHIGSILQFTAFIIVAGGDVWCRDASNTYACVHQSHQVA